MSLQAGFMEEMPVPRSTLVHRRALGERFGHRRDFIIAALVLQALVFGAAHANYPGFPAYSRLVELIVPSLIWGLIFLRFGLLPTVDPARAFRPVAVLDSACSWSRAPAAP